MSAESQQPNPMVGIPNDGSVDNAHCPSQWTSRVAFAVASSVCGGIYLLIIPHIFFPGDIPDSRGGAENFLATIFLWSAAPALIFAIRAWKGVDCAREIGTTRGRVLVTLLVALSLPATAAIFNSHLPELLHGLSDRSLVVVLMLFGLFQGNLAGFGFGILHMGWLLMPTLLALAVSRRFRPSCAQQRQTGDSVV
jgi:hypothetical protein